MTRRELIAALASLPAALLAQSPQYQGMGSRTVPALPRGKPSGIPFHSKFTDIAAEAGLHDPAIFGEVGSAAYILEVMGAGIAFLDYDNDGWLDIFMLCGSRLEGAPAGTTNRLYHNNRNGTFTDVTESAGLKHPGWAFGVTIADYNNDGFDDIFVTCSARTSSIATMATAPLPTSPAPPASSKPGLVGAPAAPSLTTIATVTSTCSSPTISTSISAKCRAQVRVPPAIIRAC